METVNKGIDLSAIQRRKGSGRVKTVPISIRVAEDVSKWIKEKNISPTGLFHEALKQIDCPHLDGSHPADELPQEEEQPSQDNESQEADPPGAV